MAGTLFNRIAATLAERAPRRETVKAFAGSSLAAVSAAIGMDGAGAKKKKCRKLRKSCGGKKKCCGQGSGLIVCREFPGEECDTQSGRRCCGLEGAECNNDFGHCDCCPGFFCSGITGFGSCQEEPT